MNLKLLEKQDKPNPKISRQKEIINIRAKVNDMETKRMIQGINETKRWFFEKINKIDKRRKEKAQINKVIDEKGDVLANTNEIQRVIKEYFKHLYSKKLENLEEMVN
jgi:hypothetical protein